ncbi:esterase/lipase family protein [Natronorubrum tibetense]|uniref:Alpha/beta hydrolase n=1 Tax=Natronorubrum tibetense GA33 TaxID=1114856 RepID=L9WEY7_9EURY|nr:alpha/beta hydrolase [Natronorubrum tibetense]ELY46883.1 hypothetical protein C496_00440 [Natronorubrum tibetense GA33]
MAEDDKGDGNMGREVLTENKSDLNRRCLLRATSAAAVGAVGVGAASTSVSAGEVKDCTDWPVEAPADYPEVDLTGTPSESNIPHGVDEICIYVHGWNGMKSSENQAYTYETALGQNGYGAPVVAATWDADTANFWGAESNADTAGQRLADWLRDYRAANPSTTIRLTGHSLGGRVSLATLNALGGDEVIDTVALLGAAVNDDTVCDDGEYADGITHSAHVVYNYHSRDDDTVCTLYGLQTWGSGVGCDGADCGGWFSSGSTPDSYHDRDVTAQVDGHCEFMRPDIGCVPQIVNDF